LEGSKISEQETVHILPLCHSTKQFFRRTFLMVKTPSLVLNRFPTEINFIPFVWEIHGVYYTGVCMVFKRCKNKCNTYVSIKKNAMFKKKNRILLSVFFCK
jgi:hypothetical protein